MGIKIVVALYKTLAREALKNLLESYTDIEVVGEASHTRDLLDVVKKNAPDVIVVTNALIDNQSVAEHIQDIVALNLNTRFIVLSYPLNKYLIVSILRAGAHAFLSKDCSIEELNGAIRAVNSGRSYLSPSVTDVLVGSYFHTDNHGNMSEDKPLTERELQVLQFLAFGLSNKEISERCNISIKTVETHRIHVMQKLNLQSMAELVKFAIREGVTSLDR